MYPSPSFYRTCNFSSPTQITKEMVCVMHCAKSRSLKCGFSPIILCPTNFNITSLALLLSIQTAQSIAVRSNYKHHMQHGIPALPIVPVGEVSNSHNIIFEFPLCTITQSMSTWLFGIYESTIRYMMTVFQCTSFSSVLVMVYLLFIWVFIVFEHMTHASC